MTTTAIYWTPDTDGRAAADLADALAFSAAGRLVRVDDTRALIETPTATATDYLHALCEADARVASYEVRA